MSSPTDRRLNDLLLLGGLAGLLVLALLLDALRSQMLESAQTAADAQRLTFLLPLMQLLLMLAALGLIWLCLSRAGYSRWVTVVYLLVGLLLLYAPSLLSILPFPDALYVLILYLSPETYLYQASGAAAALGLISLFFWKEPKPEISEAET